LPYTQQRRDAILKGDILVDAIKICSIIFFKLTYTNISEIKKIIETLSAYKVWTFK